MPEPHAIAYREIRGRVRAFVESVDPSTLDSVVAATPTWRVHDVLAHMVGVTDDVINGRLDGVASDPWTQAQVDARRDASLAEMLAEWDEKSPQFEGLLRSAPAEIAGQAIFDAATHEHDLRAALGSVGARDSDAIAVGWDWILGARTRSGAPAICFVAESDEQTSGVGEAVARVEAPRFELFRAVSGRRTAAEIAQYRWDRDPDPELLLASEIFSMPERSIGE